MADQSSSKSTQQANSRYKVRTDRQHQFKNELQEQQDHFQATMTDLKSRIQSIQSDLDAAK